MNDFQKFQDKETAKKIEAGGRCNLCTSVLALPKRKQVDLYNAMIDNGITHETIYLVLGQWNVLTSKTTVQNHRQGIKGFATHMDRLKKSAGIA